MHQLVPGQRWHDYQIEGPVPSGPSHAFYGLHVKSSEKMVVHATVLTEVTIWRRGAWERLSNLPPHARIVACVEAQEESGWRYEVTRVPPASTMREWIICHQASPESLRVFLRQLSGTLAALHAQGVVHLNIRPESIYLDDSADEIQVWLGGIEAATLYTNPSVKATLADPFYAPPETAGATEFPPGTGLCAWDWWSVGRVVQEFVIGRHVTSLLFGGDVTRPTSEFLAQARNLIRDVDPMMPRAGAVEAMSNIEPAVQTLLSGLLTAACCARWGQSQVQRWLKGEPVKAYYDLHRTAQVFIAKGRGFTLEEAIEHYSSEENWAEGETQLLPPDAPETLAHFLATVPDHATDYSRLQACRALLELPAWQAMTADARNSLVVSAAWLLLGSQLEKKSFLQLRGRRVDKANLAAWLANTGGPLGLEIVRAMTVEPFIKLIEPHDSAAAEMLSRLSRVSAEAIRRATEAGWIKPDEHAVVARLMSLALESDATLQASADKFRKSFATCRDVGLLQILQPGASEPWQQVLLILTASSPAHFGYLSQEEWDRQRLDHLRKNEHQLAAVFFWSKLHRTLFLGSVWTGRWPVFSTISLGVVLVGLLVAQDPLITMLLTAGLVGVRLVLGFQVKRLVRANDPSAQPWRWLDSQQRCLLELQRLDPGGLSTSLVTEYKPTDVFKGLRITLAAGATTMILFASQFGAHGKGYLNGSKRPETVRQLAPPTPSRGRVLAVRDVASVVRILPNISADLASKVVNGEYEIVDEGFGLQLNGPLRKWTFTSPKSPEPLPVLGSKPASPGQKAFAEVSALLLLKSFGQRPISAFIVVQVPARDGIELMLIDGRERRPADDQSLQLGGAPQTETWYQLGRRRVIFLAAPEGMMAEGLVAIAQAHPE